MSAGQHEDLISSEEATPESCRKMTERKSGSEIGLFARAGAVLATGDGRLHESYFSMGASIGTAGQIASDLYDIWKPEVSQDLLNGKKTLPIVHALSMLRGEERERFRRLLNASREAVGPHDEVRKTLEATGSLRYTILVVQVYRQRALAHLAAARPQEPFGRTLRAFLDAVSLLPDEQTLDTGKSA